MSVSRLTDLIAQAKAKDPQLGADLDMEFKVLSSRLPFGLNFERHRPEAVELPQRPIRKGDKVRVLSPRGSLKKGDQRLWHVKGLRKNSDGRVADLELLGMAEPEIRSVSLDDLVVVAEFRDTIYPGLISTGKVERGGSKPYHTVINGETTMSSRRCLTRIAARWTPSTSTRLITPERRTGNTTTTMSKAMICIATASGWR